MTRHAHNSVVDLGCAPGGWSEVAVELVKPPPASPSSSTSQQRQGCVVGIDLLPVQPPVAGATLLQGDFTDPARRAEVLRLATAPSLPSSEGGMAAVSAALLCPVDVVLSDLAPNFSGDSHTDHVRTLHLCYEVRRSEVVGLVGVYALLVKVADGYIAI